MSLAFESPTRGNAASEAYFTPLNMPTMLNTQVEDPQQQQQQQQNSTTNTPYYTAPINPSIHQEFLNAIQARHASQPTIMTSPTSPSGPTINSGFNLNLGSLAARRQVPSMLPAKSSSLSPIDAAKLSQLLETQKENSLLVLDVRSFVQYSHSRIRGSINVSIPNTILKRPTFTLDKVYEAIVLDQARERLRSWESAEHIVFYDQQSQILQENSASAFLGAKLIRAGYRGQLYYLRGGFDAFSESFKESCESNATSPQPTNNNFGPPTIGGDSFSLNLPSGPKSGRPKLRLSNLPTAAAPPVLGPFTAPVPQFENQAFNPFFSNIRQNMELSHGPIRERFPVRLPPKCSVVDQCVKIDAPIVTPRCVAGSHIKDDNHGHICFKGPEWLQMTVAENGAQVLAEMYEKLERVEQRRLQNIMHFHSKHADDPAQFPFSIVAGIEMGALNRYTNIWPYEYTRVKMRENKTTDYINASYVQYIDSDESPSDARPEHVNTKCVNIMKNCVTKNDQPYRRYISTQGPLPTTFNDFWQVVWEQNSRVLVMLTKEEEMNKIKCHRYWPSVVNAPTRYGDLTAVLVSETTHKVPKINPEDPDNTDDVVTVRQFMLTKGTSQRQVTHLHYTGWMDFGVPDNPLGTLQTIQMADEAQSSYSSTSSDLGPMIVHCSAGCGRSGAFCAIDTVLYRMLHTDSSITSTQDILLQTISRFREQRLSMVQTLRQFVFCYEAIWWWFLGYGLDKPKLTQEQDNMDTSL